MNLRNKDNSLAIIDLVADYELKEQENKSIFFEEAAFLHLISYYDQERMVERAFEVAECAMLCHPFSTHLLLRKALLLIKTQQEAKALDVLTKAEMFSPNDLEIHLLRIEAIARLGNTNDAILALETLKVEVTQAELTRVYVTEAIVYECLEYYDQMFYALKAALEVDYANTYALERLWLCVELSKKFVESIELNQYVLDQNPYSYLAWYNLGHSYAFTGYYEKAIEAYEYAYLINEDFEFAYRDCAELCFELMQYEQALNCYFEVLEHFEPDADLYMRIGQCHFYLNHIKEARHHLSRAAIMDTMNDEVFYFMGMCYAKELNWNNAIRFFEKAIEIESRREEYFIQIAEAFVQLNNIEAAEEHYQEATEIAPEQVTCWYAYAKFLIGLKREEEAFEVLKEAKDYILSSEWICAKIACYMLMNHDQKALPKLVALLEEDPDAYHSLFLIEPSLKANKNVQSIISTFVEV
jgi:tetratricopeptide (TPR) repeat protein